MAALARLYPRGPVNVGARLQPLPDEGTLPGMPGWRHIHTPGHSVGHVSFWRDAGRTVIVGDAFVTTAQESAYAVAVQRPEMHGPPMYYTVEWDKAGSSVARLAELEPELVITGHGVPMRGRKCGLRSIGSRASSTGSPFRRMESTCGPRQGPRTAARTATLGPEIETTPTPRLPREIPDDRR
jgi:glyoxylase-like metal-dependent hydrolase (beta-lactamase superfamily II)